MNEDRILTELAAIRARPGRDASRSDWPDRSSRGRVDSLDSAMQRRILNLDERLAALEGKP